MKTAQPLTALSANKHTAQRRMAGGRRLVVLLAGLLASTPAWAQQSFGQAPAQQTMPQNTYPTQQQNGIYLPQQQTMPGGGMQGGMQGNMQNGMNNGMQGNMQGGMNMGTANPMQMVLQAEMQDFGVPPQTHLQMQMHGPTPTSIPGGQVITTDRLLMLYQQGQQNGLLVFHVLGPGPSLPMAQNAVGASQAGSFNDATQKEFSNYLDQVTQGNKARPMVFYCQSTQCWMSYNAALRAINLGFTQVYWYRGGAEAWQRIQQMASNMPQAQNPMGMAGY